jgi:hypothetical protein
MPFSGILPVNLEAGGKSGVVLSGPQDIFADAS